MDFEFRTIKVGELVHYIQTDEYKLAEFWPISPIRALSHAANPRADNDDVALLLAFDSSRMIGYLGIMPDTFYVKEQGERVFWLTCMWILPDYRRRGIALRLLEEAYKICKGKIFIANYIPRSRSAFLKTTLYSEYIVLHGVRVYILFDLTHIFLSKFPKLFFLRPFLYLVDKVSNLFCAIRLNGLLKKTNTSNKYYPVNYLDTDIERYINKITIGSLFRRTAKEYHWIFDFPWITNKIGSGVDTTKYNFSQFSRDFRQWFIKIANSDEKMIGFLMLTLHKRVLKTPYIFAENNLMSDIAVFLINFMNKNRIPTLVCHHSELVERIKEKRKFFIHQRDSMFGFFTTSLIIDELKDKTYILFEGDGDGAFT